MIALVVGAMGISAVSGAGTDAVIAAKQAELQQLQLRVATMNATVRGLQGDVQRTATRLESRQAFLASLLSGKGDVDRLAAMMPKVELASSSNDVGTAAMLAPFAKLEEEQLAFVGKATVAAEARLRDAQAKVRRLGLDPSRFTGQTSFAMGGPFEAAAGAPAEPKFKELFLSWKKLDQLEKALVAIPSVTPVKSYSYTSTFGVRYDPFNGRAAMHTGLDMAGPVGEPVYASADGVIGSSGRMGAYGNMIDLDHGKGIATRYAHLSRLLVKAGDRVRAGEMIGRMGSTGRSTGSHLHFEVRVDGRAVNPRPFLEAGPALLALQHRGVGQGGPVSAAE